MLPITNSTKPWRWGWSIIKILRHSTNMTKAALYRKNIMIHCRLHLKTRVISHNHHTSKMMIAVAVWAKLQTLANLLLYRRQMAMTATDHHQTTIEKRRFRNKTTVLLTAKMGTVFSLKGNRSIPPLANIGSDRVNLRHLKRAKIAI